MVYHANFENKMKSSQKGALFAAPLIYFWAGGGYNRKKPPLRQTEGDDMKIAGLQKTTLLDYPGKVACTVFLAGCNFRCPYCQNAEIAFAPGGENIAEDELLSFLQKRKGVLDGVCITGGEPLLGDITPLLARIKGLGYAVKLDTNGSFPDKLEALCKAGLVDFVAMDIKNSPQKYALTTGVPVDMGAVRASAAFLLGGGCACELRTTVVRGLHAEEDMEAIGQWLAGAERYFLQNFRDSDAVPTRGLAPCTEEELRAMLLRLQAYIPAARIRGEGE